MGIFDFWKKKKEDAIDDKVIQRVLSVLGLSLTDDKRHVGIPAQSLLDDIVPEAWKDEGFLDFWKRYGFNQEDTTEAARKKRYSEYEFMRSDSTEVELFIDTVISEVTSYFAPNSNCNSIIKVTYDGEEDKELALWVNERMNELAVDKNECLDGMITYGNKFYFINYKNNKIKHLMNISDPSEVFIKTIGEAIKGYKCDNLLYTRDRRDKELYPFEILNFSVATSNRMIKPYGKSYLESLRASFKKLLILESLLALSRSNKVDKLVLYFPSGSDTPVDMMKKAQVLRAQLKNLMFGTGSQPQTAPKPPAFVDILLAPQGVGGEGFRYERLPSGVDLSSIEDVEYFWNKFIQGTRMPRSFFRPDEQYQGYMKLSLQDLRFSRFTSNVSANYSKAELTLAKLLLAVERPDIDIKKTKVEAVSTLAAPVSQEHLDNISKSLEIISTVSTTMGASVDASAVTLPVLKELFLQISFLPKEVVEKIFKLFENSPSKASREEELGGIDFDDEEMDTIEKSFNEKIKLLNESLTIHKGYVQYKNTVLEDGNVNNIIDSYLENKESEGRVNG